MELVNREDNYTCQHPERITRHKRTMDENEQLPSIVTSSHKENFVLLLPRIVPAAARAGGRGS